MTRHILVPLDGSALAESVVPQALSLARALQYGLKLVRVVTPTDSGRIALLATGAHPGQQEDWVSMAATQVHTYLQNVSARCHTDDVPIAIDVLIAEDPATEIVAQAAREDIAMLAMTTHGRSGIGRWLLGSVADKIIRAVTRPVLLVRRQVAYPEEHPDYRHHRILVPLDGSSFAEEALSVARQIASAEQASLILMTSAPIAEDAGLVSLGGDPRWALQAHQEHRDRDAAYLQKIAEAVVEAGITTRTLVVDGPPADAILDASIDEQADLIVMATHGRGGLQRLWLGSVATRVVHGTHVPLLLLHVADQTRSVAAT